jgi:serine protease Do
MNSRILGILCVGTALLAALPSRAQDNVRIDVADSLARTLVGDKVQFLGKFVDQSDEFLGVTLQPIDSVLRAQLEVPNGEGLLVASLRSDGPSAKAGIKQNDVLLMLADKPLAAADDLAKQLKAAGESAIALKLIRAGKPLTIQVRPIYRVTIGPADEQKTEYYLGVSINPIDDALRSQLDLPAGQGVVVNDVVKASPADKAGVKKNDVVLTLGDKPIDSPEALSHNVQAIKTKSTTLKLLRSGKLIIVPITGAARTVTVPPSRETIHLWLMDQPQEVLFRDGIRHSIRSFPLANAVDFTAKGPVASEELKVRLDRVDNELKALRRIESLEKELKELRQALEKVNESLKASKKANEQ